MKFLRNLLASILGGLIAMGIAFFMFFMLMALLGQAEPVTVKNDSVLLFELKDPVKDYVGGDKEDPFAGLFDEAMGLDEILHAVEAAKSDDKIKGIVIKNVFAQAGLAQVQAMRKALEDFKTSGKFVYAYSDYYPQKDYYLASVADSVYLNPVGGMDFMGLASEVLYFKDVQEKSGLKMEVIRHGKYKSAVEPFLANEMSAANREQISELLHSVWGAMAAEIADSRNLDLTALNKIADTLGARSTKMAVQSGLIDGIPFYDEFETMIKEGMGKDSEEDLDYISLAKYMQAANTKKPSTKNRIAVIYAQGDILFGEGNEKYIGQGLMTKALRKAREDEDIKAIVLRVNSPGGSALVSDIIWREVELTKAEKPVVVSMGNVAASGGYYIATGAHKIFAEPTTITGSIGVFGTIPNGAELMGEIGINAEQVGTHANSIDYSFFEPMGEGFRNRVQEGIEETYNTFLSRVSEGRGMTVDQVNAVAQGRVWSGVDALENGLVDELGGLEDAIAAAAELAEVDTYRIKNLPHFKTGLERFMADLSGAKAEFMSDMVKQELGSESYEVLQQLKAMSQNAQTIQARMPFALEIK
ncbi:signal peptide peptidase SppA [Sediminicola luteus]|uniref:Signal peptide peptidase SppA n=1 Tax=Sediminicola luteus TaxID=319238 RepID=A0A2A4G5N8_9FLAO|nr:signal peptide peptidase SppA [Sediminicola luteus]PCE63274.1 signal peptide peptidase SppA [Sediminicola luteus]